MNGKRARLIGGQGAPRLLPDGPLGAAYRHVPGDISTPELPQPMRRPLDRPRKLEVEGEAKPQRRRSKVTARASWWRILLRGLRWLVNVVVIYFLQSLVDRALGKIEPVHQGIRLRQLFERMGGTGIKIGQQLSVRADLFPWEVCEELAKLRDRVPAFPVATAIDRIERAVGECRGVDRVPLGEIFEAFDDDPIGAASIACVYQAFLRNGKRVAVKVRRPHVQRRFGADLGVLEWTTKLAEWLAFVPPDFFKNLRIEMRDMLEEELDFALEARYQGLFRYYAKKDGLKWLGAPKVYLDYCSQDVLVSEFVEGVWCDQILKAHEAGDQRALAELRKMGITPKKVGERLMEYSFWCRFESIFFHSDPHPGNIVIQEGCKLVFIDFGSCGTTSRKSRMNQLQMIERMAYNDVSGTVEAALATLEPLPCLDVHELKKEIEKHFWAWLFAFRDKKARWWERTTASIWFALLEISRKKSIPVGLETLRLARSLMLIDTLCFELDPQMVSPTAFKRYMRRAARRGADRVIRDLQKTPLNYYVNNAIWQADELISRGRYMAWQVERIVDSVDNDFLANIKKSAYVFGVIFRTGLLLAGAATAVFIFVRLHSGDHSDTASFWVKFKADLEVVFDNPLSIAVVVLICLVSYRKISMKLKELDVE